MDVFIHFLCLFEIEDRKTFFLPGIDSCLPDPVRSPAVAAGSGISADRQDVLAPVGVVICEIHGIDAFKSQVCPDVSFFHGVKQGQQGMPADQTKRDVRIS